MSLLGWIGLFLTVGNLTAGVVDGPPNAVESKPVSAKPADTIADRYKPIVAEYEAVRKTASVESGKAKTQAENYKTYIKLMPDEAAFSRRLVDLAMTDPKDPAARDALLWVLDKHATRPTGPYADECTRAVLLLLRHHGDDPEVARVGIMGDNICSTARDLFFEGINARAKGHETKGMAKIALAKYLVTKAKYTAAIRKIEGPVQTKEQYPQYDENDKLVTKEVDVPAEDLAYHMHLRTSDPAAMEAEAKRLFEEVSKDYGDVLYVTRQHREHEALLRDPSPKLNGEPLTPEVRKQLERRLAHKQTLADVGKERLAEMETLVVGNPAPPIGGVGMDGKPLKLSDFRGKVVVLVFWGTWCGPCMMEVPHEREMANRYQGKPFAMLGVDCDGNKVAALKVMKDQGITWPNWNDDDPGEGPIAKAYFVRQYPTIFVLDTQGVIRYINAQGEELDKAVDQLLKEEEAKEAAR